MWLHPCERITSRWHTWQNWKRFWPLEFIAVRTTLRSTYKSRASTTARHRRSASCHAARPASSKSRSTGCSSARQRSLSVGRTASPQHRGGMHAPSLMLLTAAVTEARTQSLHHACLLWQMGPTPSSKLSRQMAQAVDGAVGAAGVGLTGWAAGPPVVISLAAMSRWGAGRELRLAQVMLVRDDVMERRSRAGEREFKKREMDWEKDGEGGRNKRVI